MVARLVVIGAALIALGLLHVWGDGMWTAVAGAVLVAVGAVIAVVRRVRSAGTGAGGAR
jgi:hypothetical protein